jgi:hypothetical protein
MLIDVNKSVYTIITNVIDKLDKNIKKYIINANLSIKNKSILKAFLNKHKNIFTKPSELNKTNTSHYIIFILKMSILLYHYNINIIKKKMKK